jgi:hypothetical protein
MQGIDTLKSHGDLFSCSCGYTVKRNDYCCFEADSSDSLLLKMYTSGCLAEGLSETNLNELKKDLR